MPNTLVPWPSSSPADRPQNSSTDVPALADSLHCAKVCGFRPLVITSALRRISLKAVVTVITPDAVEYVGEEQYAIGRPGGVEDITHGLQADAASRPGRVVASLDLKNAFGTMSRSVVADDLIDAFPELTNIISLLYCTDTPLLWEDGDGKVHSIDAHTGVDQGCPFSLLAFVVGLRRVLRRAHSILQEQGMGDGVASRAYVEDVGVTCAVEQLAAVIDAFRQAAAEAGMTTNDSKLKLWGQPCDALPAPLQQDHTQALPLLGHTVERSNGMHTLYLGDAGGSFDKVTVAFKHNLERLWLLHAKGGLPKQTAQALARTAAQALPQHVLRGSVISTAQASVYDYALELFWPKLVNEQELDPLRKVQLHLPLKAGDLSAGGVEVRADAAFLAGTLGSLPEVFKAAGVETVAELRRAYPSFVTAMDNTAGSLVAKGVAEHTRLWPCDQPQPKIQETSTGSTITGSSVS